MGETLICDVSDDTVTALEKRAAKNGRSAEAEHRAILVEKLTPNPTAPDFDSANNGGDRD